MAIGGGGGRVARRDMWLTSKEIGEEGHGGFLSLFRGMVGCVIGMEIALVIVDIKL